VSVKSTTDRRFATPDPLPHFRCAETLAYIQPGELLDIHRGFHQDNVALSSVHVNV
jgi:hypothetical protein